MKVLNLSLRTILLTLALIGSTISALAYNMFVDGVYYDINGNEATVTYIDYNSNYGHNYNSKYSGHVTIPERIYFNGLTYTVVAICPYAFENCTNMTSVAIPNTITAIRNNAFNNCI